MKVKEVLRGVPGVLADGQLPSSKGTLYTVPSTKAVQVTGLKVVAGTTSQTVTIYVKSAANAISRRFRVSVLAAANDEMNLLDNGEVLCLGPGDVVEGFSTTAATNDYTLHGMVLPYTA